MQMSTRQLTDAGQKNTDTYDFDAFGNLINKSGTMPNDYLYAGEQFDANVGFYYLRARYYDPATGRFISQDAFGGNPFEPLTLHKYTYAHNNPINGRDPSGHFTLIETETALEIAQVIGQIFPTLLKGFIVYKGVDVFYRPGFEMRNFGLEMLTYCVSDQCFAAAVKLIESGNRLIGKIGMLVAATKIQECQPIVGIVHRPGIGHVVGIFGTVIFQIAFDQGLKDQELIGGVRLKHVALVTGLKHYLGPFEMYAKVKLDTPLREEMPRLPYPNFFYAQEDALFEAAKRQSFTWSVHRSHTTIGYSIGTSMNMGVTLAAYAVICRETGRPFVFPGSSQQWDGLTDVTDARVLAKHMEWASISEAGRNQAFNIVNGDIFRWRWLWPKLAADFGIDAAAYPGHATPLEPQLADAGPAWAKIAAKHGLAEADLGKLASAWHTDADLGREIEVVTDMTKSRLAGFHEYQPTLGSFLDLFARLRKERIIPEDRFVQPLRASAGTAYHKEQISGSR